MRKTSSYAGIFSLFIFCLFMFSKVVYTVIQLFNTQIKGEPDKGYCQKKTIFPDISGLEAFSPLIQIDYLLFFCIRFYFSKNNS